MKNKTYYYSITAQVPLGIRKGSISVTLKDNHISGIINLLNKCSSFTDGEYENGQISFSGILNTLISKFHYNAKGTITEQYIKFNIESDFGNINISGENNE